MVDLDAEPSREELLAELSRLRGRLDAYDLGMHQLYGALCTVMNRARAALRHGEPLDALELLDFVEGRYHDVGETTRRRVQEVERR